MADRPAPVALTGLAATTAFGRGSGPLLDAVCAGRSAFTPVTRFDVSRQRAGRAATLPGSADLVDELVRVVDEAADTAGLTAPQRADCPVLLAAHADPAMLRGADPRAVGAGAGGLAAKLAARTGFGPAIRGYTNGCVA